MTRQTVAYSARARPPASRELPFLPGATALNRPKGSGVRELYVDSAAASA